MSRDSPLLIRVSDFALKEKTNNVKTQLAGDNARIENLENTKQFPCRNS